MDINKNIKQNIRVISKSGITILLIAFVFFSGLLIYSCQKDEEIKISMGEPIELSLSDSILVLSQEKYSNPSLTLSWSRGTNHGTGSSISYLLEIDKAGDNFANPQVFDLGKGVFEKGFTVQSLNDFIRNNWDVVDGIPSAFEAKVTSDVTMEGVEDGITDIKSFSVSTYKPVTSTLYLVGDATPNGWDISNATEMTPSSSQPWIFTYQGQLSYGTFKFAVNQDGCWCQDFYTKNPDDDEMMVYNEGGSGDDVKWNIEQGGNYKLTVNLLELKISIEQLGGPAFSNLYIVGDATPSGWDIGNPKEFTKDINNPSLFTYEAVLTAGEFKISTFKGNWCDGQWINASQADQVLTATDFIVTNGCDGPDNKWKVTEETKGRYKITVNLITNKISIEKVNLYLIGDGGPNGWNIDTPEPMTYADGVYTFKGELGATNSTGEFKFSKYIGNWCGGEWILATMPNQSISNTSYTIGIGCQADDNKWKLQEGEAGTYVITINLDKEELSITKQ